MIRFALKPCVVLTALMLCIGGTARADRLHLESGGYVDTARWWYEGDWLHYDSPAGTIGMPRSMVLKIEERAHIGAEAAEEPPPVHPAPAQPVAPPSAELVEVIKMAHGALERRDFETAATYYRQALSDRPDLHVVRVGYAASEIALGNDGMALSALLDGLALDPTQADFHELLGEVRNREERVPEALRAWREAYRLAPTERLQTKILKAERELAAGRDLAFTSSSHFNVRYDGTLDRHLAGEVIEYLEEQYWRLSDLFRHSPQQPITLLLYPTRQFKHVTQAPEGVGGIYDGKIRVPLGGLSRLNSGAESLLRHELAHAVVHSKTRGNCPRWLHEGLAQIIEGRPESRAAAQRAVQGLSPGDSIRWNSGEFSYPLALSLTRFLEARRRMDGLVWLLDLLGEGTQLDPALRKVYGYDHAGISRLWLEDLVGERDR